MRISTNGGFDQSEYTETILFNLEKEMLIKLRSTSRITNIYWHGQTCQQCSDGPQGRNDNFGRQNCLLDSHMLSLRLPVTHWTGYFGDVRKMGFSIKWNVGVILLQFWRVTRNEVAHSGGFYARQPWYITYSVQVEGRGLQPTGCILRPRQRFTHNRGEFVSQTCIVNFSTCNNN